MSPATTQRATVIVYSIGFLSDFDHISSSSSDFHKSPRHDISRKSAQWQPRWYNVDRWTRRTGGRTDWQSDNRGAEFFQKCRSHLKILGTRTVTRSKFHKYRGPTNIWHHLTKLGLHGDLTPRICAPLPWCQERIFMEILCRRQQYKLVMSSCKNARYFDSILLIFGVYRQIFVKVLNMKYSYHEFLPVGAALIHANRWTGRQAGRWGWRR